VTYALQETAALAGVEPAFVERLVELGILAPEEPDRFSPGDVRRVLMACSLEEAGIPLESVAAGIERGEVTFAFFDAASYERFVALADETFQEVSDRTGVPLELLCAIREAIGLAVPAPTDRMREDELQAVPFLELQIREGFRPIAIERLLRVQGDSMRRITEAEGDWWSTEVIEPAMAAGRGMGSLANPEFSSKSAALSEQAILAIYHARQARAWAANIIEGLEVMLDRAGIHSRLEVPPAICFLDITGYTRLTQEQGDDAAAEVASTVARLVQRGSVPHGGKPVKWLGDGVMFHFREPGPAVRSALEMVDALRDAGLPPAHVGIHAGPVLFQEGDSSARP
jgi:hypothetical protein